MKNDLTRALLAGLPLLAASSTPGAQQACFSSTGGPHGDFDWVVQSGEIFFFDTTFTPVIGGPNGVPSAVQNCIDGMIEVRNLIIEAGGQIRVQGPNPMRIQASGDVIVRGSLDLSGFNAKDVATLNTGNQVELGGVGSAGGGPGGRGNPLTTQSSPRGGPGQGPFHELDTGGEGGESAYAPAILDKDARRPGGGGGARFADDRIDATPAPFSLAASDGHDGHPAGRGAESGQSPAQGGAAGVGAFVDAKAGNDFFGIRPIADRRGRILELIRGELAGLWAGYGGGGGGNAIPSDTFPNPNWTIASDEKGGGGGGGGGSLHVQALGRIIFGAEGVIRSDGGRGATGENTNFLDHIGGTGGAGSGGHVVLETAELIDFTDSGLNANMAGRDWITAYGRPLKTGPLNDVNNCCKAYSNGGASGGGVLQLHVPNPVVPPGTDPTRTDIVVPTALVTLRNPLNAVSSPEAYALFPTCDPFPPAPFGWFGTAGLDARRGFVRIALDGAEEREDPAQALIQLELPRKF